MTSTQEEVLRKVNAILQEHFDSSLIVTRSTTQHPTMPGETAPQTHIRATGHLDTVVAMCTQAQIHYTDILNGKTRGPVA